MKGSKKEGGSRKGEWKLDGKVKNLRITQMELQSKGIKRGRRKPAPFHIKYFFQ